MRRTGARLPRAEGRERFGLFAMEDALHGCYLRIGDPEPLAERLRNDHPRIVNRELVLEPPGRDPREPFDETHVRPGPTKRPFPVEMSGLHHQRVPLPAPARAPRPLPDGLRQWRQGHDGNEAQLAGLVLQASVQRAAGGRGMSPMPCR